LFLGNLAGIQILKKVFTVKRTKEHKNNKSDFFKCEIPF